MLDRSLWSRLGSDVTDLVGHNLAGDGFHLVNGGVSGISVGHHAREIGNAGENAAIRLTFDLNAEWFDGNHT